MSKPEDVSVSNVPELTGIIHDLRPLLRVDPPTDDGTFSLSDVAEQTGVCEHELRGPLRRALKNGSLERIEKERKRGSWVWRYRWRPDAKAYLLDYLDEMDTLPCGCRLHVPDTRGDPDGVVTCGYCGEEYVEAMFMDFVEANL